ncbi:MAG: DUF2905 domain-containing protein [Bacillota bacterium]
MDVWHGLGKTLILIGVLFAVIGGVMLLLGKIPWIGRLPGDVYYHRGNFTFYFPLVTCILLSVLLTLLLNLFFRR